jgi:superfamily II DNA or RNA helicase
LPWLRRGPAAPAREVAGALARAAVPAPAGDRAPAWLRPDQRAAFGTLLTILRRHRGALLADPTGSGKTFVALAVAEAAAPGRTAALVPATLRDQWQRRAAALGITLPVLSHESVSRGALPSNGTRLVIVDEAHRFRNPGTRRYRHLAAWLGGRAVLLVTATPVVNSLRDLTHQLRLGLRDDALRPAGIPSLEALGRAGLGHSALGEVVVARGRSDEGRPSVHRSERRWGDPTGRLAEHARTIAALRLSRHRPTAELIRGTFWSAAASSPAALHGAARRYGELLDQAADARAAGRRLSRAELRHFTGPIAGQLVLWELVEGTEGAWELELSDRDAVAALARECGAHEAGVDPKLTALRASLADGRATLIFAASVETVRYLRRNLPGSAWCTGAAAGVGHVRTERDAVPGAFRPGNTGPGPRVLVATDIAAEGLDLQGAGRVIHYDRPWTPMRLAQREGRIVRLGSPHRSVEVVTLTGPDWLERQARRAARIRHKEALLPRAGLGAEGAWLWRWRHDLAERASAERATEGSAVVSGQVDQLVLGLELQDDRGRVASAIGIVSATGEWHDDPAVVVRALDDARQAPPAPAAEGEWDRWLGLAMPHARRILREGAVTRWSAAALAPEARKLLARLRAEGRSAAQRRDAGALRLTEAGISFATRGHTAGERLLVERLAPAPAREFWATLRRLPAADEAAAPTVRIAGAILFTTRRD